MKTPTPALLAARSGEGGVALAILVREAEQDWVAAITDCWLDRDSQADGA